MIDSYSLCSLFFLYWCFIAERRRTSRKRHVPEIRYGLITCILILSVSYISCVSADYLSFIFRIFHPVHKHFKTGYRHNNNMLLRPTRLQAVAGLYTGHSKRFFSSSNPLKVELAYQLVEPSTQDKTRNGQPIVFMHGFMGNKLNNRSISKYDLYFPCFVVPETREWVLTDLVDRALARDLNRDIYIVVSHDFPPRLWVGLKLTCANSTGPPKSRRFPTHTRTYIHASRRRCIWFHQATPPWKDRPDRTLDVRIISYFTSRNARCNILIRI